VSQRLWLIEFACLLAVASLALLVGSGLGHPGPVLLVVTAGFLGWERYRLHRFESWIRHGARSSPPGVGGVWGTVYSHAYRQRQRHRKRKRKLAKYLRQVQESTAAMPDATVVLRESGEIDWFNDAAMQALGLRRPQDVGQRLAQLWRHPDLVEFLDNSDHSPDEAIEVPARARRDIRLSVRVIDYAKNRRLLMARDITRLSRLEEVRRDFVANVSHELRTPLTVISGYLEAMLDTEGQYPAQWRRSLLSMHQQAERMGRLINDLLLLSRLEISDTVPAAHEPVAVPAIIAAVHEDAEQASAGRHNLRVDANPGLWLRGDAEQLRSVVSNLVSNAVRYTPEGGQIQVRWYADAQAARLEVTDTGIGIPAQHIPRLTERFYRVDPGRARDGGGTGLGLAIVKHVLNRHGAALEIRSVVGEGSQFICAFPTERVVEQQPRQAEVIALPRPSGTAAG